METHIIWLHFLIGIIRKVTIISDVPRGRADGAVQKMYLVNVINEKTLEIIASFLNPPVKGAAIQLK